MKKEEIYVVIDSEEKRLRAIQILTDAKEVIYKNSMLFQSDIKNFKLLHFTTNWALSPFIVTKTEITLDQLQQLLNPNFVVKEVVLSIDELQKQAENLGFELVKKERQIKVGDFGKFSSENGNICSYGFLYKMKDIESGIIYVENNKNITTVWSNFSHLTDEEKKQIQENW